MASTANTAKIYAHVDYEDTYMQPLILAALKSRLPPDLLVLLDRTSPAPPPGSNYLQWRQYESLDFDDLLAHPRTTLANSYVIRKALIRKHYLSATVAHWLSKHPGSLLARHVKQGVEFEVDYAEFLDEALVEAFELRESWGRNEGVGEGGGREWWILKAGMGERGQGVRLFSSEEELGAIFEEWDPVSSDEEDECEDDEEEEEAAQHSADDEATPPPTLPATAQPPPPPSHPNTPANGIITTHLRHFTAQPYIHPPLLLPAPHPSAGRKFHIRTYVLCVGALQVLVYKPMLALFASAPYAAPSVANAGDLRRHLTNTCLQTGEREGSVHAFWDLPQHLPALSPPYSLPPPDAETRSSEQKQDDWRTTVFAQICLITAETFQAAAQTMGVHFQPLPNAFEVFGVDFMVDAQGAVWLLEVNAFPDFAQTGGELKGVVEGLVNEVVEVGVKGFFGLAGSEKAESKAEGMVEVLDLDLGRR
ncbi:hypothetical protein LTR08_005507 [Meristemomyces frigidus]|nr:hypothetical protein LTR08_005507 [Meristemomyces frigidus]